jgi:hypothetical protein
MLKCWSASTLMSHKSELSFLCLSAALTISSLSLSRSKKDGSITDDTRIREALPTINYLIDGGARVVLSSHCGRPDGKVNPKYTLAPMAARLSELLSKRSSFGPPHHPSSQRSQW